MESGLWTLLSDGYGRQIPRLRFILTEIFCQLFEWAGAIR